MKTEESEKRTAYIRSGFQKYKVEVFTIITSMHGYSTISGKFKIKYMNLRVFWVDAIIEIIEILKYKKRTRLENRTLKNAQISTLSRRKEFSEKVY